MWFWTVVGILVLYPGKTTPMIMPINNLHMEPGPWVIATQGSIWPIPFQENPQEGFLLLRPSIFQFTISGETCDILEDAVQRYTNILMAEARAARHDGASAHGSVTRRHVRHDPLFKGNIVALEVNLGQPCERLPHLNMNESYSLVISNSSDTAKLNADSVWGILKGLESFSQLLSPSGDGPSLRVPCKSINDKPRLPHRGLLLDTSRHFLPVSDILLTLDAMSYNKLNVFHWHIVDDNSFPYVSTKYPDLSGKGAYHPTMVYSPDDVQRVIEYARLRGIRVLPEFDTPGHTRSWGQAYPDLLTTCYKHDGQPDGTLGPMNPTDPTIYRFLRDLFAEIVDVFPDQYIHLGGDEVPFNCWASNPQVLNYMQQNGMGRNFALLEEEYIQNVVNITTSLNASSIVWQEVFDNGVHLEADTVVHVWTGNQHSEMEKVTRSGFPVLLSACWYLDAIAGGGDWKKFYYCDPLDFPGSADQKKLMLGGEACMWGEFVDRNNVHQRIWPRACAAAEKLWSHENQDINMVARRLEEHACRMNRRGIPAQPPNGAGFCVV